MAGKVLSIEIGKGVTNVVEMDYRVSKAKIYDCFSFETPQGVIRDGVVLRNELFTSIFKTECNKRGIRTKKVVFVVSSSRIASRDVKVPLVKEKLLPDVVNSSATEFFPVDMTQYHLIYKVTGKENTEEEKNYKLNVLAVPNDLTSSYFDMATSLGLELVALDYVGNAIMQTVGNAYSSGTNVIVKAEEENTLVTIIKDGHIILQRTLSYGVSETINLVREREEFGTNLSYLDAIKILSGKTIIRRFLNVEDTYKEEEDTTERVKMARIEITESLRYLIGNIGRVLEFYSSRNENDQIDEIVLTGLGAGFSGLSKLMTNELNQKVKVCQNFSNASFVHEGSDTSMNLNSYAVCIGAGLNPMNLIPERTASENGETSSERSGNRTFLIGLVGGIVMLLVAAGLYLMSLMNLKLVQNDTDRVEKHIQEMRDAGVEAAYEDYNAALAVNTYIRDLYFNTQSRSEDLLEFIGELEEKLPSALIVNSFTANQNGVTLSIKCASKEVAAKTLMQLQSFESVAVVSSSGLNDNSAEAEETDEEYPVTFTVECAYKALLQEENEN